MTDTAPKLIDAPEWEIRSSRFPGVGVPTHRQNERVPILWLYSDHNLLYLVNSSGSALQDLTVMSPSLYPIDDEQLMPSENTRPKALGALPIEKAIYIETIDPIADSDWFIAYEFSFQCTSGEYTRIKTPIRRGVMGEREPLVYECWEPAAGVRLVNTDSQPESSA